MGYLLGLQEYLDKTYHHSVFDHAVQSRQLWEMQLHGYRLVKARITESLKYDIKADIEGEEEVLPKIHIKFLYPENLSDSVRQAVKVDKEIKEMGMSPIPAPGKRYHIKNKSLFPLMKERTVIFFTLMEGEIIKGIIADFSRYEITISLKGGIPVTVLRHSIYDARDKRGRCFLKTFQEIHKDWEKSECFVSSPLN